MRTVHQGAGTGPRQEPARRGRRAVAAAVVAAVGFGGAAVIDTFLLARPALAVVDDWGPPGDGLTRVVVTLPAGIDDAALGTLAALPGVDSAQRLFDGSALVAGDGLTPAAVTAALPAATAKVSEPGSVDAEQITDPLWASYGWHLRNTGTNAYGSVAVAGADVDAPSGWAASTGRGLVVAVVDSGFDMHPDLAGALWTNPDEACGGGDVDGNGYAGDCHGWNFYRNTADVTNAGYDNSHGTSVSGTIAARRNGIGTAGIAPDVTIMPLAVGAGSSIDLYAGAQAIRYAADNGADVINCSWGGFGGAAILQQAIDYANSKGVVVVVSAGNDSGDRDTSLRYPGSLNAPNLLTVGSSTAADTMSDFSGYGARTVDLFAPGSYIVSTTPGGGYGLVSGTSFSSPIVAGAVAQYRDVYPDATAGELAAKLVADAVRLPSLAGRATSGARLSMTALGDSVAGVRYTFTGMNAAPGTVAPQIVASGSAPGGAYAVTFALGMEHAGQVYALTEQPVTLGGVTAATGDDGSVTFELGSRPSLGSLPLSPSLPLEEGRYVLTAQLLLDGAPLGRTYAAPLLIGEEAQRTAPQQPAPAAPTSPAPAAPGSPTTPSAPGTQGPGGSTPAPGAPVPGSPAPGTAVPSAPGTQGPGGSTPAPGTPAPGTPAPGPAAPGAPSTPGTRPPAGATPAPAAPAPSTPGTQQPGGSTSAPGTQQPGGSTPAPGTQQPGLGGSKTYPSVGPFGLTSISPTRVAVTGGTRVTVTGARIPAGVRVRVGDTAAATVVSASTTQLVFITPARAAGVYDVHVFAPDGTEAVLVDGLTYVDVAGGGTPGTPGTPAPGTPAPGTPAPGTPAPGTPAPGTQQPGGAAPVPGDPVSPGGKVTGPRGQRLMYSARFAALGAAIWSVNCSSTCTGLAV